MRYRNIIDKQAQVLQEFFRLKGADFDQAVGDICTRLKGGNMILVFGNGGSAAQAQHFAAELVNTFLKERPALAALSLCTDTSSLTSIANDSSFEYVFSRQVEAMGRKGDVALGLSTSGDSPNVVQAFKTAKRMGLFTVALTGEGGGTVGPVADVLLDVPSKDTPRIQEGHLFLLHLLAQEIEEQLA